MPSLTATEAESAAVATENWKMGEHGAQLVCGIDIDIEILPTQFAAHERKRF